MRVMFVDDERMILSGLKRAFFRNDWQIYYADSAELALKLLQKQAVDFVVSDMRMPGLDGAALLTKVADLYPQTVRIILSGHSDEEASKRASFVAHQWLSKPCQPQHIEALLNQIYKTRNALPNQRVQQVVGEIKSLPAAPRVYMQINAFIKEDATDMQKISTIIAQEPALVAKILQLTNTSFFANAKHVESLTEAITRLGLELVCSIVMAAETYSQLDDNSGFSVSDEQKHCLSTARFAATMVEPGIRQEAVLVGLLHNIGKFILYKVSPDAMAEYLQRCKADDDNIALEHELFHTDHTQLAGYLLHLWNFSYSLIENIVLHHSPEKLMASHFGSGAAVYVASRLLRRQPIEPAFIEHFALADKLEKWQSQVTKYN
ncbi:HDOD domain-containing protein [Litorilituus sediminis]|uniref:HDOD domain-containing protein n=1 Tax=Litorilituus sediminis TaxID=718192 RepID=A0A4P6P1Y5_9GAMM|nr:HDOD domain-containing protein [Litorilituus sediminis]QBG35044.1 HDOD domain-containing protein [Litorilituus sediminis]